MSPYLHVPVGSDLRLVAAHGVRTLRRGAACLGVVCFWDTHTILPLNLVPGVAWSPILYRRERLLDRKVSCG